MKAKSQASGDHVVATGNPDVGQSVGAGPLRRAVRVRAALEQPCFLCLGPEAGFLGGFLEDVGNAQCVCGCGPRHTGGLGRTRGIARLGRRRGREGGVARRHVCDRRPSQRQVSRLRLPGSTSRDLVQFEGDPISIGLTASEDHTWCAARTGPAAFWAFLFTEF